MTETSTFTHRILIQPLGLLYGSKGRFLSPENLVGRSGSHFPPDTPTLSGLFAAHYRGDRSILDDLKLAGPFWAKHSQPASVYVPTPSHCGAMFHREVMVDGLVNSDFCFKDGLVSLFSYWQEDCWQSYATQWAESEDYKKYPDATWIAVSDWPKVRSLAAFQKTLADGQTIPVKTSPWKAVPHLHPRLREDERRSVGKEDNQGSLFLEYGIQLHPEVCLVYLSTVPLPEGSYRFGGEGHIVQVTSEPIQPEEPICQLLDTPTELDKSFAIACPAVWGSNRLSYRAPFRDKDSGALSWPDNPVKALLTQRPSAFRFRLGNQQDSSGQSVHGERQPKLLSRGRYAVPAGSIYVLEKPLEPWRNWPSGRWPDEGWFPYEGFSFKRWGCALALPLEIVAS
ncbi:MAG: CRISPR-associated protein Cmr3 [Leptolyngbya sp. SIO1E4]|nr:CRISPR-associated protein Cmr3 [Leptolyngbya sp. SIO1E4]